MRNRPTVLIVGASGFIGRHLTTRLAARAFSVHAHYQRAERPTAVEGVTWIRGDLQEPTVTRTWPARCDHVVFLAQSPNWRDFPAAAEQVFQVNVAGALRASAYAASAGARSFLLASSGSVYTETTRPALESDPIRPELQTNFYGASKLAAESLVAAYSGLMAVIRLRLFTPYGPGQDKAMLIRRLVRRVREGTPIELHGKDGLVVNPLWVGDLAEAIERCLSLDTSTVLNIGGPDAMTLREIGNCIGRVTGLSPRFEAHDRGPVPTIVGDRSALRSALCWSPGTTFESGLREWLSTEAP